MDPILAALAAGAAAALKDTATQAVKDGYAALKAKLSEKFAPNPKHGRALEGFVEEPEDYQKPMEKAIVESGAAQDPEIAALATKLSQSLQGLSSGKTVNVQFNGPVKGAVVGDNATVTMNFDKDP